MKTQTTKPFVKISVDDYDYLLDKSFEASKAEWGGDATIALWDQVKQLILDIAPNLEPDHNSPGYVVDNYLVNSDMVSREEFEDPNYFIFDRDVYDSFEEYAQKNGVVWNENYVCLNLGLM